MPFSLIAALSRNNVIGINNRLPWHLPADLQHFKKHTVSKKIVMGRNTFEALGCKPLPNRSNIILTKNSEYSVPPNSLVIHSLDELHQQISTEEEVMIVGGSQIYQLFLPLASKLLLTLVDTTLKGDSYFPPWNTQEWIQTEKIDYPADDKNCYTMHFITLVKNSSRR